MNDAEPDEQDQITPDDGARQPKRNTAEMRTVETEQDHARNQQEFIRQRVKDRTQLTPLVVTPCDISIDAVADRRNRERKHRQQPMHFLAVLAVIKHFHNEKWNEENPQDGDFIRGRHLHEGLQKILDLARMNYEGPPNAAGSGYLHCGFSFT